MSRMWSVRGAGAALLLAVAVLGLSASDAPAAKFKKLYDFCSLASCADGANPIDAPVQDAAGNLYGTTNHGGDTDNGVVFKLTKAAHGYKYSRLYSFCALADCADGGLPHGKLVIDVNGNIYGTATDGGPNGEGVVFELVGQKTYKILYATCAKPDCADGHDPVALTYQGAASGALYDGTSPLYGSNCCGAIDQNGAVFKLVPKGNKWKMTTLYVFCKKNCKVGSRPTGDLLVDAAGNLYSTTQSDTGTLLKLDSARHPKLLHKFCTGGNGCPDGIMASGGVAVDAAGVLYGTTVGGGTMPHNSGVIYKYDPHSHYSVITDFCDNCGSEPTGTPVMDAAGNLYGVTSFGGPDFGSIFALKNGVLSDIFDLCGSENCGSLPVGGLAIDGAGTLFGTTEFGGTHDTGEGNTGGTMFQFTP